LQFSKCDNGVLTFNVNFKFLKKLIQYKDGINARDIAIVGQQVRFRRASHEVKEVFNYEVETFPQHLMMTGQIIDSHS